VETNTDNRPVIFFDGVCNLCNHSVQFIIHNDKQKQFLFASLQSVPGQEAMAHISASGTKIPDSFILFYNGNYYFRSSAALHTFKLLGGRWTLLYAGIIITRLLRDGIYDVVSRNRYKWFGKQNECMVPTADLTERFLK
jgi:predicted DCC family thiol-disulfide oxidoreductase YuxK